MMASTKLFPMKMGAIGSQRTIRTFWPLSRTDFPPEQYNAMTEIGAFLWWQYDTQLAFHFFRIPALGKTQTLTNAHAVGIANYTAGHFV